MMMLNKFEYSKYLLIDETDEKKGKRLFGEFLPTSTKPPRHNKIQN